MEKSINTEGAAKFAAPDLASYVRESLDLPAKDLRGYSPLTLAFIGDDVYDLVIRTLIVERGNAPVNILNQRASRLVSAVAQCRMMEYIEPELTEGEKGIFRRGKNAKSATASKNAPIHDYHIATGILLFSAEAILREDTAGGEKPETVSNAAWQAPSGSLSSMFQAGALIELSGDTETAFEIYYDTYDIHELPPLN